MIFSGRFRYACSGFGVVSFYFPHVFPSISLLGLAASGAKFHFEIQKIPQKNFVARKNIFSSKIFFWSHRFSLIFQLFQIKLATILSLVEKKSGGDLRLTTLQYPYHFTQSRHTYHGFRTLLAVLEIVPMVSRSVFQLYGANFFSFARIELRFGSGDRWVILLAWLVVHYAKFIISQLLGHFLLNFKAFSRKIQHFFTKRCFSAPSTKSRVKLLF